MMKWLKTAVIILLTVVSVLAVLYAVFGLIIFFVATALIDFADGKVIIGILKIFGALVLISGGVALKDVLERR